jgi:hypothetical protein
MLVDLRPAIRGFLLADDDITAIVGSRIYPVILPQGVRQPSIVYHIIDETEAYHYRGPVGLVASRVQIDAIAPSADAANNLALLAKERLSGFAGPMEYGGSPPDSVDVQSVQFITTQPEDFNNDLQLYTKRRDYMVWFVERMT